MQKIQNINSRIYISDMFSSTPSSWVLSLRQNHQGLDPKRLCKLCKMQIQVYIFLRHVLLYTQLSGSIFTSEPPRSDLGWIGLMDVRELVKEFAKYAKCKFKDIYFWGFFRYSALWFYFYVWVGWGRSHGHQRTCERICEIYKV